MLISLNSFTPPPPPPRQWEGRSGAKFADYSVFPLERGEGSDVVLRSVPLPLRGEGLGAGGLALARAGDRK